MNATASSVLERAVSASPNSAARSADRPFCGYPAWKRALDLTFVLLTMPLWLPLMMLIGFGIKIVSPGCIFFRQERVGEGGRSFMIFKFRSMKVNAETVTHEKYYENLMRGDQPMTKLDSAGDPRIIPLGRLLRASGLDELPQIINVLRGEMSLVGPRPCTPREFARYEAWQRARSDVVPGLTGFWQVNGKDKTTFNEMINMDIHYSNSMSLKMDLSIMLRTIPTVAGQVWEARKRKRNAGAGVGNLN